MRFYLVLILAFVALNSCKNQSNPSQPDTSSDYSKNFTWDNATVYFLLTDRFNNGDKSNDGIHNPEKPPAPYRGFMGGDIKGVTAKIKEGYFNDLGVNAIWTTPLLQNIAGSVDEGTGESYGFHGYWTRDWTAFDSRFGTEEDFAEFVQTAHNHGIRVIMDIIVNHTGPVTEKDPVWPSEWVRTEPKCAWQNSETTITCTLVENLPDIKTESLDEVELPPFLVTKWKNEGRYEQEVKELDDFFTETGYPRRPYYYIVKWLVDYIKKFGVDGFRGDTVKHTEEQVWKDLFSEAKKAFALWKKNHPEKVMDESEFYMVGEVYNYHISEGRLFDFGDKKVDYFEDAYHAMINFDFKADANNDYESIFSKYDQLLHGEMKGKSVLNYISSHDDGSPFDLERKRTKESATKLLLTQGGTQIYYGDEIGRSLTVEAKGDARLRSFMDWDAINNAETKELLTHWQKLGSFRNNHPSIGAGSHKMISEQPYTFMRTYQSGDYQDDVVIALDAMAGKKTIKTDSVFKNGTKLIDHYSKTEVTVENNSVELDTPFDIVLLEKID